MNRFHNKYHRHNHHTLPTVGEPDSAHDPIASPSDPYRGDFHILGTLSCLSANFAKLQVKGDTTFLGSVTIASPITYQFEHMSVIPELTTRDFYFKIDTQYDLFPLTEIYLRGYPAFFITSATDVGIGTSTPTAKLDVRGSIVTLGNFSVSGNAAIAGNVSLSSNFKVTGNTNIGQDVYIGGNIEAPNANTHFSYLTVDNSSNLGYLKIGYEPNAQTYIRTISGNKDIYFYSGESLNLKMHQVNRALFPSGEDKYSTNYFTGKVGILTEPTEDLTINGQQSFRQNGLVLLDNSYKNTLRLITNRELNGVPNDDTQHLFCFTSAGNLNIGERNFDFTYNTTDGPTYFYSGALASSDYTHQSARISVVGQDIKNGSLLHLTNITSPGNPRGDDGAAIRLFRANGSDLSFTSITANQCLGGIRAFGYDSRSGYGDATVGINFVASNNFDHQYRGGRISIFTTHSSDPTNSTRERVKIDHNGNFGINTIPPAINSATNWRNPTQPDYRFTVYDEEASLTPVSVVFAGRSAPVMTRIIGGESISEQVALQLSDRSGGANNINHIQWTHGTVDTQCVSIASKNNGSGAANGANLLFYTTYDGATPVLPFERVRITASGDLGIGYSDPNSRVHIHDDNKKSPNVPNAYGSGTTRDVVTISTLNNTNGIYLSSANFGSRIYNNNTSKDLYISTCTAGGTIKLATANEAVAMTILSSGNVGVGISDYDNDVGLDNYTENGLVKFAVKGNIMLFNQINNTATISDGPRLYFNVDVGDHNTDPVFITRVNRVSNGTDLKIVIGDDGCGTPTGYEPVAPTDNFYIGSQPGSGSFSGGTFSPWLRVTACTTTAYGKLSAKGDTWINGNTRMDGTLYVDDTLTANRSLVINNASNTSPGLHVRNGDLQVDGNIYATGDITAYWSSDRRLKQNIAIIPNSLEKISQINGVYFDWDEEAQSTHKGHDVGVIAQEIESILPEVVATRDNGYKAVKYEKIIPLLIECIKDLKKEIDELKSK